MSCGLGAIILVFMLVKYNVDTTTLQTEMLHQEQGEQLQKELASLKVREAKLRSRITNTDTNSQKAMATIRKASKELALIQESLTGKQGEVAKQRQKLLKIQEKIKTTEVAKTSDVIDDPNLGEENYLIGLKVEGKKIAILLDSSASMTDEILLDVIRRKNSSDQSKKAGPKWQRTKRILRWLLARLPNGSSVDVIAFNDRARPLGSKGWKPSRDPKALGSILRDLDSLVPQGSTSLQAGLEALARIRPSNVYVITDGLPTAGDSNYKSLNPFASCSSLWGKSNTISGECRLKLFQHTIKTNAPRAGVRVNIILLPIEGDPAASTAYWSWSSNTGGLLISPAESWP
jgi:hypothetical protein